MFKIGIFAVGNELFGDDSIGQAILEELRKLPLPEDTTLYNAASDPLLIAQEVEELKHAIIIDAANMQLPPGEIRFFNTKEANFPIENEKLYSNHHFSLAQVIKLIETLGFSERLLFVGIQPYNLLSNQNLDLRLKNKIPQISEKIHKKVLDLS